MEYEVGGITFTITEDAFGKVINIKSDNAAVIALIGEDGISFSPGVPLSVAEGIIAVIVDNLP